MKPEDLQPVAPGSIPEGMTPDKLSPIGRQLFNMIEFDNDEVLLAEIRKHPFGLFVIYATGLFVSISVGLLFFIVPILLNGSGQFLESDLSSSQPILLLLGFILFLLTMVGTLVGAYLYTHNVIIVTSEKLTQIVYKNIFNRKISQLSIGDVQDTTVDQKGIFAHLLNFGTIVVETAGEQANYNFTYVGQPYEKAKLIVGSHEVNLKKYGN